MDLFSGLRPLAAIDVKLKVDQARPQATSAFRHTVAEDRAWSTNRNSKKLSGPGEHTIRTTGSKFNKIYIFGIWPCKTIDAWLMSG
jgi:hypothetical protein